MKKHGIICAGGTAGHILPAKCVGKYLSDKGIAVKYYTGTRPLDYALFENEKVDHFNILGIVGKNPKEFFKALYFNIKSFVKVISYFLKQRPHFVLGFGGHVSGPICFAAYILTIPVYILESNAVSGLSNKLLSLFSNITFVHFKETEGLLNNTKVIVSGNPVREEILHLKVKEKISKPINVLVFGGSLGAKAINEFVKETLLKSDEELSIIHVVGKGNLKNVEMVNKKMTYKQSEFISDMPKAYEWSDIIISRAGAGSVSEIFFAQRPCIFFPLTLHRDMHQYKNALNLKQKAHFPVLIVENNQLTLETFKDFIAISKDWYKSSSQKVASVIENPTQIIGDYILASL